MEIYKDTHRAGFFTPTMTDGKLDRQTIQKLLPRVREKKQWISSNIKKVSRLKNLDSDDQGFEALQNDLECLLVLKKVFEEKNLKKKKQYLSYQKKSYRFSLQS